MKGDGIESVLRLGRGARARAVRNMTAMVERAM